MQRVGTTLTTYKEEQATETTVSKRDKHEP